MKKQSCMSDFIRYTILSVLGTLGVSCYILADTFFVSKGLGTNGLAALNLAIPCLLYTSLKWIMSLFCFSKN